MDCRLNDRPQEFFRFNRAHQQLIDLNKTGETGPGPFKFSLHIMLIYHVDIRGQDGKGLFVVAFLSP